MPTPIAQKPIPAIHQNISDLLMRGALHGFHSRRENFLHLG